MGESAKRYGSRYGKRIRKKVSAVEEKQKKRHRCPKCEFMSLKRQAKGIWKCTKCGNKVAGGAWKPEVEGVGLVKKALKKADDE